MAISVQCPGCGSKFQAPEELAGKRAKCPRSSAAIHAGGHPAEPSEQVTSAKEPTSPILVPCSCGKKFRAKAELAGERVKCPACSQILTIPGPQPGAAAQPMAEPDLERLIGAQARAAALPRVPLGPSKKKADGRNTRLIVRLSAGAATAVLVLLLVVFLWPSGDDKEAAKKEPTPSEEAADAVEAPPVPAATPPDTAAQPPRTYPSFPDAVTEPPSWIGPEAPFDVAKFFEAPPPEENAAPLYLDALFEFSPELSTCFCPRGEAPQGEAKRRWEIARQREKEYYRLEEAWRKDPRSVDNAAVDAWLAHYETGFQKLAQAQKRPRCVFQTGLSLDSLLPHASASRQVARVVQWRSRRDLQRGDLERPLSGLESAFRLSRDLRARGGMIIQLYSIAMDDISYQQLIPGILTAPTATTGHCDRLIGILAQHEQAVDLFLEGLRGDYLVGRSFLHDLEHCTGMFDSQPTIAEQLAPIVWPGTTPEPRDPDERARQIKQYLTTVDFQRERDALDRWYRGAAELSDATFRERGQRIPGLAQQAKQNKLLIAEWLAPLVWCSPAIARHEAFHGGTKCLIALRRWQLEHDAPPPDLVTLVKAAGMQKVPTDPYSHQPMQMTTIEGETVIYGFGIDGKDDKGRLEWDLRPNMSQGDIVFRLRPPR